MVAFGAIEGPVGALRQPSTNPYREGGRSSVAGCFAVPYQGLSPVPGNLHAGFLVSYRKYRRETKRGPSRDSRDMLKLSAHEIPQP